MTCDTHTSEHDSTFSQVEVECRSPTTDLRHKRDHTALPGAGPQSWSKAKARLPELLPTNKKFCVLMLQRLGIDALTGLSGQLCTVTSTARGADLATSERAPRSSARRS